MTILEAAPVAGGFLRLGIPSYRLPEAVVERDIDNVRDLGVQIETGVTVRDLPALKEQGFDAVLVATGTHTSLGLGVPGEDRLGVLAGTDFLRKVKLGQPVDIAGKRVAVVGGGNVAMDTARTARRLGAASVIVAYRRGRDEMPAHHVEADDAEKEGVAFALQLAPVEVTGDAAGAVSGLRCQRMRLGEPDASGRRRPEPIPGSEHEIACDVIIAAIGMRPDTSAFGSQLATDAGGRLVADAVTRQTALPFVFAAGDAVHGPTDITRAVGEGRRAAHMIDRWLTGGTLDGFDDRLPVVDKAAGPRPPEGLRTTPGIGGGFDPARRPRPTSARWRRRSPRRRRAQAPGAVWTAPSAPSATSASRPARSTAASTSTRATRHSRPRSARWWCRPASSCSRPTSSPSTGSGGSRNVITGMQMDRLLAPTRPFNTILRPGDGKVPERIAYILCTGSRDEQVGNPLCSRFCCMYSIKQNQLLMGALPLADVTVHYMDIRAPGKRYDEFYEQAKSMGANYVKGRVADVRETPNGDLILKYEDIENGGGVVEAEYDLVVLAVGVQPNHDAEQLFEVGELAADEWGYVGEPEEDVNPGATSIPGVFVAGAASGAKDIADSILHAGAAVAQVAAHLQLAKADASKVTVPA